MGLPFAGLQLLNGFLKYFQVGRRIKGIARDNLEWNRLPDHDLAKEHSYGSRYVQPRR